MPTTQNHRTPVRGRPSKYSEETKNKVVEILTKGGTLREAAEATGMSVQAVSYHKRKYGIRGPRDTSPHTEPSLNPFDAEENRLIAKYDSEISRTEDLIKRATARLKLTLTKRNKLAKAFDQPEREVKII